MFYTIIWLIVFLVLEKSSLAIGTLPFWGLVVAIIADILWVGFLRHQPYFK